VAVSVTLTTDDVAVGCVAVLDVSVDVYVLVVSDIVVAVVVVVISWSSDTATPETAPCWIFGHPVPNFGKHPPHE
jgi:hypothetical protein